jgi:ABC-type glycerol-3-phosphate transport system substrate-binding protein
VFRAVDDLIRSDSTFRSEDWFEVHTAAWKIDGKQVGLPWQGSPHLTYYNKALFVAAGISMPPDATWTWDAWRDAANKLRRVMPSGEITRWPTEIGPWLNFFYAGGGEVLDKDYKRCVMDSTAAVNALQRMSDYIQRDQIAPSPRDMGTTRNNRLFMDSRLAIIIMNRFDASVEGFFQPWVGVANQPTGPAGRFSGSNVDGFGMATATKEVPAAWELQKFRTGDAFRRAVHASGNGGVPALKTTANSPEYLNEKLPPEWNRFFVQAISTIRLAPAIPAWTDVLAEAGKAVTQIQNGEAAPASVVKDLVPRANALLQTS